MLTALPQLVTSLLLLTATISRNSCLYKVVDHWGWWFIGDFRRFQLQKITNIWFIKNPYTVKKYKQTKNRRTSIFVGAGGSCFPLSVDWVGVLQRAGDGDDGDPHLLPLHQVLAHSPPGNSGA